MNNLKRIFAISIGAFLLLSFFVIGTSNANTAPTYVILVHGYNMFGTPGGNVWAGGVNLYQQLIHAGYIVGVVSYYGEFKISFSNGYTISDPNFYGTQNIPIEQISKELGHMISVWTANTGKINLDIVAHSMGGLVTIQMLEHYKFSNVNLENVICIASPFNGSPFATIASVLGLDIFVGYQADEMVPGSAFLTTLHNNVGNAASNYPSTTWIMYAGNYDPWWGYFLFNGDNDGVVSVNSATYLGYSYLYVFPDLHTYNLGQYTWSGVSYFEDQSVANTLLQNLAGNY